MVAGLYWINLCVRCCQPKWVLPAETLGAWYPSPNNDRWLHPDIKPQHAFYKTRGKFVGTFAGKSFCQIKWLLWNSNLIVPVKGNSRSNWISIWLDWSQSIDCCLTLGILSWSGRCCNGNNLHKMGTERNHWFKRIRPWKQPCLPHSFSVNFGNRWIVAICALEKPLWQWVGYGKHLGLLESLLLDLS